MNPYTDSIINGFDDDSYVSIDEVKLKRVARQLAREDFSMPAWREPVFPQDDNQFVGFIVLANAINFCAFDPVTHKRYDVEYPTGSGTIYKGSMAIAAALKRALDQGFLVLEQEFVGESLDDEMMRNIFRHVTTPLPLLEERLRCLKEVSIALRPSGECIWPGVFCNSEYRAFNNGTGVVERFVSTFPGFRDESSYDGCLLRFHKRAMLLATVYHGRACSPGSILTPLKDAECLGPIADYQIAKILEYVGVLRYHLGLSLKISAGVSLLKNTPREISIRARSVQAMCLLLEEINKHRATPVIMVQLDYRLWSMARILEAPHHYTVTTAY